MADVFISYNSKNRDIAENLADILEAAGYFVWWDRRIEAGRNFTDEILQNLNQSRAVVSIWSKHANESRWVFAECLLGAVNQRLIPLVLDNTPLPVEWATRQMIDVSKSSWTENDAACKKMMEAVGRLNGRPEYRQRSSNRVRKIEQHDVAALNAAEGEAYRTAQADSGAALFKLSKALHLGGARYADKDRAIRLLRLATAHGHTAATYHLGCVLGTDGEPDRNQMLAFECFQLAAEEGVGEAQYNLAQRLLAGGPASGAPSVDERRARECFRDAAQRGLAKAQHNYAIMCFGGVGGPVNRDEGARWLLAAVQRDFPDACLLMAGMIIQGELIRMLDPRVLLDVAVRRGNSVVQAEARAFLRQL